MTMPTALDYLPPPPARRPEIDAKQAPSLPRYKSVRILFAFRDKSAHIPFAPDVVSDATNHPRGRASRRQFIPSRTPWQRVGANLPMWKSGAQMVESVSSPAWQTMSPLVLCRGVGTVVVLIMFRWSSLAKLCSKSIIKCTYPAKK